MISREQLENFSGKGSSHAAGRSCYAPVLAVEENGVKCGEQGLPDLSVLVLGMIWKVEIGFGSVMFEKCYDCLYSLIKIDGVCELCWKGLFSCQF